MHITCQVKNVPLIIALASAMIIQTIEIVKATALIIMKI